MILKHKAEYERRLEKALEILEGLSLDAMLLVTPINIFYMTGVKLYCWNRYSIGGNNVTNSLTMGVWDAVLIAKNNYKLLIYSTRSEHYKEIDWFDKVMYEGTGEGFEIIKRVLRGNKRIGTERNSLSLSSLESLKRAIPRAELISVDSAFSDLQMIKSNHEIELIKKAAKIADSGMKVALEEVEENRTEIDIARVAEQEMQKRGADDLAFKTTISSGERAWIKDNWLATERRIRRGDSVWIDVGPGYLGYASDMTRTIYVGTVAPELYRMREVVTKARQRAIDTVKPGVKVNEVDSVVKGIMVRERYSEKHYFHCSHGTGMNVVEPPAIWKPSKLEFEPGMTFTIEIGIHIPKIGGYRVEDVFVVTEKGVEQLTHCSYP